MTRKERLERSKIFKEHLDYLCALHKNSKTLNDDWQYLKEALLLEGHWKNKARGQHAPKSFFKRRRT